MDVEVEEDCLEWKYLENLKKRLSKFRALLHNGWPWDKE